MKTLILGPLDYPSARQDLILANYNQNVYSAYYAVEGIYSRSARNNIELPSGYAALMLLAAAQMTDKEYESSDIFFGLMPQKYHVDRIIEYNYETLMAQEALVSSHYPAFEDEFYTTANITHSCNNIMEAIKLAQSPTEDSD